MSKSNLRIAQCQRALVAVLLVMSGFTTLARAQGYPSRVVRVVVAYPAGGSIDVVARLVSQRLSSRHREIREDSQSRGDSAAVTDRRLQP